MKINQRCVTSITTPVFNFLTFTDSDWNKGFCCRSRSTFISQLVTETQNETYLRQGIIPTANVLSWASKKQATHVAESTKSAENYSVVTAIHQVEWQRNLLAELGLLGPTPSILLNDNLAVVVNGNEFKIPNSQRHNALKWRIIEDALQRRVVSLFHVNGLDNFADMLTKQNPLPLLKKYTAHVMAEAEPEHLMTAPPSIQRKLKKLIKSQDDAK
jgi:hypothetical protein